MYGEQRRPEIDPEAFIRNLKANLDGIRRKMPGGNGLGIPMAIVGILVALIWLGTGFYTVGPSEQAALRLFGEFRGTEGTGLHWYPPAPIGTRNVEAVQETKTIELGFRSDPPRDVQIEAQMITGDLNIVDTQLVVQYRISDLGAFLFNVDDPGDMDRDEREGRPDGRTLRDAAESALRQVVGQRSIDDPLRVAKTEVQEETAKLLREILDSYDAGIEILSVQLQTVRPPDIVRDAFDDVNRARVDKESRINESLAYEQDQLPRARGSAQQVEQAAAAFKTARIARANGEAAEFNALLAEYKKSKEVTRERLYLEAMQEILPGISIFIIDQNTGGVLPFLPLTEGAPQLAGTTGGSN